MPALTAPRTVGVLHPGQMGAAVAAAAVAAGHRVLWCREGRGPATADRAARAGLIEVPDLVTLMRRCDVVLSICPPAVAEELAVAIAEAARAVAFDGVVVEANAISAARAVRIADLLRRSGARPVDGAIIGPPPADGRGARLHIAGEAGDLATVAGLFGAGAVQVEQLGDRIGAASALKMAFGGYQKATRALAAVAHALAARHGVTAELLAEADRMPSAALADPGYVPGVAARAWRWEPEMHEVAQTLAEADLPTELAEAAAAVLHRWAADRDDWDLTVDQALDHLSGRRAGSAAPPRTEQAGPNG